MVGYNKLEVRRKVALLTSLFKVLRDEINNPAILEICSTFTCYLLKIIRFFLFVSKTHVTLNGMCVFIDCL